MRSHRVLQSDDRGRPVLLSVRIRAASLCVLLLVGMMSSTGSARDTTRQSAPASPHAPTSEAVPQCRRYPSWLLPRLEQTLAFYHPSRIRVIARRESWTA